MNKEEQIALRYKVNFLYDCQRLRIQSAGRTNNPKAKVILRESDKDFLKEVTSNLLSVERKVEKEVSNIVSRQPIWEKFLLNVRGIGEKSAGVLISSIDIYKSNTPSALWLYAGLGVVPNVKCQKCGHESWHNKGICQKLVKNKDICGGTALPINTKKGIQRPIKGERISYNSWLKSKLLGVIGPNFLKLSSPYRKYYDEYKEKFSNKNEEYTLKHKHNAAIRYMIKRFLIDFWQAWRTLEKLPICDAYIVKNLHKI